MVSVQIKNVALECLTTSLYQSIAHIPLLPLSPTNASASSDSVGVVSKKGKEKKKKKGGCAGQFTVNFAGSESGSTAAKSRTAAYCTVLVCVCVESTLVAVGVTVGGPHSPRGSGGRRLRRVSLNRSIVHYPVLSFSP